MNRLTSLNPQWLGVLRPAQQSGEGVTFDCPVCGPKHRLVAYFKNPRDGGDPNGWTPKWEREGIEFSDMTLAPSLAYACWHGWIEGGIAIDMAESPAVVPGSLVGVPKVPLVALSPNQAEKFARGLLAAIEALRQKGAALP